MVFLNNMLTAHKTMLKLTFKRCSIKQKTFNLPQQTERFENLAKTDTLCANKLCEIELRHYPTNYIQEKQVCAISDTHLCKYIIIYKILQASCIKACKMTQTIQDSVFHRACECQVSQHRQKSRPYRP